jgi:predicted NBD/HSP70 family sugar kinase
MKKILVVDIGGTHVKLMIEARKQRQFASGPRMAPKQMVAAIKTNVRDWRFDAVSIGFPAPIQDGRIIREPKHLGKGWLGFQFGNCLGKPVQMINDAAMQALGSYRGGRMLFLGLGTGLGSALALEQTLLPLELGDLPYRHHDIIENYLGIPGIERLGLKRWKREVIFAVSQLKKSFIADYVVLGGGNAHRFKKLPAGIQHGDNLNVFLGGRRLWETDKKTGRKKWRII